MDTDRVRLVLLQEILGQRTLSLSALSLRPCHLCRPLGQRTLSPLPSICHVARHSSAANKMGDICQPSAIACVRRVAKHVSANSYEFSSNRFVSPANKVTCRVRNGCVLNWVKVTNLIEIGLQPGWVRLFIRITIYAW